MNSSELTLVVPVFNEGKNIPYVVNEIRKTFMGTPVNPILVIVNDGSSDDSAIYIKQVVAEDPQNTLAVDHPYNLGLGAAIRTGYLNASTPWVSWLPSDGQFLASDILKLYNSRDSMVAVMGRVPADHRVKADNWIRLLASKSLRLIMKLLHPKMPNFNGLMVIRRDVFDVQSLVCTTGFVNMEILDKVRRKKMGHKIKEESITIIKRVSGTSKVANIHTTVRTVVELIKLRIHYLLFFRQA